MLYCRQQPTANAGQLLENWRGHQHQSTLGKIMAWEHHIALENQAKMLMDILENLFLQFIEQRKEVLLTKAKMNLIQAEEKEELKSLLNKA
jgi:DNA primase